MRYFLLILAICFFSNSFIYAQSETAIGILTRVQAAQQQVQDFQAYYTQKTWVGSAKPTLESGRLIQKGSKIRRETQTPQRKLFTTTPENIIEIASNLQLPNQLDDLLAQFKFELAQETPDSWVLLGMGIKTNIQLTITVNKISLGISQFNLTLDQGPTVKIENRYQLIQGIWVLSGSSTRTTISLGNRKTDIISELNYDRININSGINDALFEENTKN